MSSVSTSPQGSPEKSVPRDEVLSALETLLASEEFSGSARLSSFLRHVVLQTLEGREEELTEYSIATEALGRGPSYDPRLDTIVRVQARRLRQRLDAFYGRHEDSPKIQIEVPKGSYRATF